MKQGIVHRAIHGSLLGLASFVVSLAGSALQSVTQVQDNTLLVVPRIGAGLVTLWLTGHWMSDRLSHFASDLLRALGGAAT